MVVSSLVTNHRWEWAVVGAVPDLAVGARRACGGRCGSRSPPPSSGFGLGTVLALMRLSRSPLLRRVAWGYTWVFRSVPLILQLLLWYNLAYLYPELCVRHPVRAGVRRGRHPVDRSTSSAPRCSGSGSRRRRTPPRSSAPASSASTRASTRPPPRSGIPRSPPAAAHRAAAGDADDRADGGQRDHRPGQGHLGGLRAGVRRAVLHGRRDLRPQPRVVPLLMVAAIWYLVITTVLTVVQYYVERHYAKGALRTLPPTPAAAAALVGAGRRESRLTGRPLPGERAAQLRGALDARRRPPAPDGERPMSAGPGRGARRAQVLRHARGARGIDLVVQPGEVTVDPRPVGLGQVDAAARHQPPGEGRPRVRRVGRRARRLRAPSGDTLHELQREGRPARSAPGSASCSRTSTSSRT